MYWPLGCGKPGWPNAFWGGEAIASNAQQRSARRVQLGPLKHCLVEWQVSYLTIGVMINPEDSNFPVGQILSHDRQQTGTRDQLKRFAVGKLITGPPKASGGYHDAFKRAFGLNRALELSERGDTVSASW